MKAYCFVVVLLVFASSAFAQETAARPKITPQQIITLYRKAVGLDALAQVHNVHIKASFTAHVSGFWQPIGDLEACYDADGRSWERTEYTGHSTTWGYDGQKYWAAERARSFPVWWNAEEKSDSPHVPFSSPFLPFPSIERNPDDHFELLGVAAVGKLKTFLIRVTHKSGYSQNLYFDTQSYFLIRTDVPLIRDAGSNQPKEGIVQTVIWSDYKTFGKVAMPHKIRLGSVSNPDSGTTVTLDKVEFDVKFDPKKYMGPR